VGSGAGGVGMGRRSLLRRESTVAESVKRSYRARTVADTVVTSRIDGVPHRVLRTEFVDELEHTNAVTALPRALRNAVAFKKMSGTSWRAIVREGLAMRKEADLKWSQPALAANTPTLLRAGLVEA